MTSSGGVPYLGSKISLISRSEIRYEGILYTIDTKESTVALAKVRSYGTEDRPTDRPVAPRDETYEYIIFRGADIKDIRVCQPPKPQPTLEGGLPNDPAIVQHSAGIPGAPGAPGAPPGTAPFGAPGGASAAPGQKPGQSVGGGAGPASSYGPIGSSGYGGPFRSGSGSGAASNAGPSGSPVMDLLREGRSGGSSPAVGSIGGEAKSSGGHESGRSSRGHEGRGRGGAMGFYRGGRGRGMGQGHYQRGGPGGGRGGTGQSGRGGKPGGPAYQPGQPTANKNKDPLKFDDEYDFDKANEEFKEFLDQLQKTSLESNKEEGTNGEAAAAGEEPEPAPPKEEPEEGELVAATTEAKDEAAEAADPCYNKAKSFFDSISCEAVERSKGNFNRPDWKAEKKLNRETFGVAGNVGRRGYYNRRGQNYGGYHHNNRGGGYNNYGQGGQGNRGGYNNGYNGRYSRDGYRGRGGGGGGGGWGRGQRIGGRGGNRGWVTREN